MNSSTSSFKILAKIAFFIPLAAFVAVVNYTVDPAFLFKSNNTYEFEVAKLLTTRKIVANVTNYDERLVQKHYIELIDQPNDIVVLGSSHIMQLGSNVLGGRGRVFISAVSGASLQDILAIYHMYKKRGFTPRELVIGIDPWIFNKNSGQDRYKSIEEDYLAERKSLNMKHGAGFNLRGNKNLQLLSPSYFQASLAALWLKVRPSSDLSAVPGKFFAVDSVAELKEESAILTDGQHYYEKKMRLASRDEVNQAAVTYAELKVVYGFADFFELDPEMKSLFEAFLKELVEKDGVSVSLVLPPYHPLTYERMVKRSDTKIITQVESYVSQMAKSSGVRLYGSYDPKMMGLDDTDFFDGMHPKESAWLKYFAVKK